MSLSEKDKHELDCMNWILKSNQLDRMVQLGKITASQYLEQSEKQRIKGIELGILEDAPGWKVKERR